MCVGICVRTKSGLCHSHVNPVACQVFGCLDSTPTHDCCVDRSWLCVFQATEPPTRPPSSPILLWAAQIFCLLCCGFRYVSAEFPLPASSAPLFTFRTLNVFCICLAQIRRGWWVKVGGWALAFSLFSLFYPSSLFPNLSLAQGKLL